MPAEPAASASDPGATDHNDTTTVEGNQAADVTENEEAGATEEGEATPADGVMEELGIPAEVREKVEPKVKKADDDDDEEDTEVTEGDPGARKEKGVARDERDGDAAARRKKPAAAKDPEAGDEEEEVADAAAADANLEKEIAAEKDPAKRGLLKRVLKQRRQIRALREEQQQQAAARAQRQPAAGEYRPAPTADDPFADVDAPQELKAAVDEYRSLREWAQLNPDGGVMRGKDAQGKVVETEYSAADVAQIVASTTRILEEHLPRKIGILQERALHEQVAREREPDLFKDGTDANRFYKMAFRDISGLRNVPGAPNMIRWAWMGRNLELQQEAAAREAAGKNGDGKSSKASKNPKVATFLRAQKEEPPLAPNAPAVRTPPGNGSRGGSVQRGPVNDKEAIERFAADGADDTALENLIRQAEEEAKRERDPAMV